MKRIALFGALGLWLAALSAHAFEVQTEPPANSESLQLQLEETPDLRGPRLGPTPRMPGEKAEDTQFQYSNNYDYAGEQLIPGPPHQAPGWMHSLSPSTVMSKSGIRARP